MQDYYRKCVQLTLQNAVLTKCTQLMGYIIEGGHWPHHCLHNIRRSKASYLVQSKLATKGSTFSYHKMLAEFHSIEPH